MKCKISPTIKRVSVRTIVYTVFDISQRKTWKVSHKEEIKEKSARKIGITLTFNILQLVNQLVNSPLEASAHGNAITDSYHYLISKTGEFSIVV